MMFGKLKKRKASRLTDIICESKTQKQYKKSERPKINKANMLRVEYATGAN